MNLSRDDMLAEMGITPRWRLRDEVTGGPQTGAAIEAEVPAQQHRPADPVEPVIQTSAAGFPEGARPERIASLDWEALHQEVASCRACVLCEHRKQAVLGVGDRQADWLFIGEGPGADEDVQGEPFVGQAGKLLDNMLAAIDLKRGNKVYIGNAVKCRPPGNRTPEAQEMAACRPFLERQIDLIKPKLIVLLGRAAVHSVLAEDKALSAMRGKRYEHRGIPVVVTYHPAYLLRNLPDKAKAWEDLLFARRLMAGLQAESAAPELPLAPA